MTAITFVTVCRARLAFLRQSLPAMIAQPGAQVVLVDYSCPEQCGDWAALHFPAVRVIRVPDQTTLNIGHARNLGVTAVHTPWVGLVDCDVVLDPSFLAVVAPLLKTGCFFRAFPESMGISGTWLVGTDDFRKAGGYDDVFRCYGDDDYDAFDAMRFAGLIERRYPSELIYHLRHGHDLRTQQFSFTGHRHGVLINRVYRLIKWELASQRGAALDPAERGRLYDELFDAINQTFPPQPAPLAHDPDELMMFVERVLAVRGQPASPNRLAVIRKTLTGL